MSAPNVFRSSKWKVSFSNIPTVIDITEMNLFDNYVRALTIPSYSIEVITSNFKNFVVNNPISRANDNPEQITIEFNVSEDAKNYYAFFTWQKTLRYGQNVSSTDNLIRHSTIKSIDVTLLDNEKNPKNRLSFSNAFLTNLGSLNLVMGSDSNVSFSTSFIYEEFKFENL
jgi:hypothetical protein